MKNIIRIKRASHYLTGLIFLLCIIQLSGILYSQDPTVTRLAVTRLAEGEYQYEDIHYTSIEEGQILNPNNLIRVLINKASAMLIDNSIATFDNVEETVFNKLKINIKINHGGLDSVSIIYAKSDLKILIRKSVYTSKTDYLKLMELVNRAIWKFQRYLSMKVYQSDYNALTPDQKNNIKKLVPLNNLLGEDDTF